jgi:hypothetical protein
MAAINSTQILKLMYDFLASPFIINNPPPIVAECFDIIPSSPSIMVNLGHFITTYVRSKGTLHLFNYFCRKILKDIY